MTGTLIRMRVGENSWEILVEIAEHTRFSLGLFQWVAKFRALRVYPSLTFIRPVVTKPLLSICNVRHG